MSNKVTNIYIDVTGFCDEARSRVKKAFEFIVKHNGIEDFFPLLSADVVGFDGEGIWEYHAHDFNTNDVRRIGLWELESIAFRCKQEKKEEKLPTRNIYIDARKLDQEQRRDAFFKIRELSILEIDGWSPGDLAEWKYGGDDASFILFDIFGIDGDGDRRFYSGPCIEEINDHMGNPHELTFDQLMSLTR